MVFARRSALRAVNATRAFRSAPVAARSSQLFGRRFYSSGKKDKGYEEHTTSDLPWLFGSIGIGGPLIGYIVYTGPSKDSHGHGHEEGHEEAHDAGEKEPGEESPAPEAEKASDSEEEPKKEEKSGKASQEKEGESKDADNKQGDSEGDKEGDKKEDEKPEQKETPAKDDKGEEGKESDSKPKNDEPKAAKPPGGPESISFKQEGLSNADTNNPHIGDEGKSVKGEGEIETAKVKGTVSPERPQA